MPARQDPLGWDRFALLHSGKQINVDLAALGGSKIAGLQRRLRIRIRPRTALDWILLCVLIVALPILCITLGLLLARNDPEPLPLLFWPVLAAIVLTASFMSKRAAWAPVAAVTGARLAPVRSALRSSDPARRAQFDALLERRRVHWSMKSEHPRLLGNWGAALPSQGWFWGVLLLMVWFLAIAFDESYGVLVLFGGMVLMLGAPVLWTWRVGRFARNAIHRQRCPHCAYDLRGLDPGFPEIPIAGPEICPECAHAWPLVPPPTPNEIHARLDHRAKALTPPVCDACGYALDGLRGHICPECGCEQDTA